MKESRKEVLKLLRKRERENPTRENTIRVKKFIKQIQLESQKEYL